MSLIEEHYQDEQGNWLPEAEEILAKATVTIATNNGKPTLLPLDNLEDCFSEFYDAVQKDNDEH